MKINNLILASISTILLSTPQFVSGQKLLNRIENGIRAIDNASNNYNRHVDNESKKHKNKKIDNYQVKVGNINFGMGKPTISNSGIQPVSSINLTTPSFYQVQLSEPIYETVTKVNDVGEYGVVTNFVNINYYINNELITSYSEEIERNQFRTGNTLSFPIVPASQLDFKSMEMSIGVFAHVFSSLNPGTHELKLEYSITQNIPKDHVSENMYESQYDHKEIVIATGKVNLEVDGSSVNAFAKNYGRPKFSKGFLQGQTTLENQVTEIIKREFNRTPIYMYASDAWNIHRGAFDVIKGREGRIYYIYKAENGRCELHDFMIYQNYEGNNYGHPLLTINKYAPAFKYVVCQNY